MKITGGPVKCSAPWLSALQLHTAAALRAAEDTAHALARAERAEGRAAYVNGAIVSEAAALGKPRRR